MCGRYVRTSDKQRIADAFHLGHLDELVLEAAPSYNIAPTTNQPVIVADRERGERTLRIMRWGLIPSWVDNLKEFTFNTINAKAEVINIRPMWRIPFERRRCLVPADAYYECLKIDAKTKQPYAFGMNDDAMFAMAGIWERWREPGGGLVIDSFSIITTEANELAANVHKRMPVILKPGDYDRWLRRDDTHRPPVNLLRPFDSDQMRAWKVDPRVGNVRNDEPGLCVEWE